MFLPQNDISEVVLRQRHKRDNLFKELNKNKSKLNDVTQQYEFLTQPLTTDYMDECERLDDEIDKLRRVCQAMLNEIERLKRSQEAQVEQIERLPVRPAPPPPPYPPPRPRPHSLFPRQQSDSSPLSPRSPESPASHSDQVQSLSCLQGHVESPKSIDDVCDPNCGEQPWQCSMCTFQNHPLLNKCECCDNVRILPGSIRILPSRPPPPIPLALGTRSAPQTPATPITPIAGPSSARVLSRSTEYNRPGVANSSSEGSMPQFLGDVTI